MSSSENEIRSVVSHLGQTKEFEILSQIVSAEIQNQLGETLAEFEQAIADGNSSVLDLMSLKLQEAKEESESIKGAIKRLHQIVAPDIPDSDILTFDGVLANWQRYGTLYPTQADIDAASARLRRRTAWNLFWQAIAAIMVNKIRKILVKPR